MKLFLIALLAVLGPSSEWTDEIQKKSKAIMTYSRLVE
jgi:hypothetical protein